MHSKSSARQDPVPQRKRPHREESLVEDSGTSMKSSPRSRKSRTEIFAPGSNPKVGDSTRSKRARLGKSPQHSADTLQTRNQDLTHVMLSNFPSSPKHSNFVDLTSSPSPGRLPASPYFPRSNGAKTASQQNEISERFKVKNLRAKSSVDPDSHFHLLWGQLDDSLELVFAGRASNTLDEEDYRRAQAICQQGDAPRVSDRLRRKCGAYVKGPLKKSLLDQCHNSNVDVLRNTVEAWATWQAQVGRVRAMFYYLDRSYLLKTKDRHTIEEMGTKLFKENIINDVEYKRKVLQGVYDLCEIEREEAHGKGDSHLLREAISMIKQLDAYSRDLEPILVRRSTEYFKQFAEKNSTTLPEYLQSCQKLIENEEVLCNSYHLGISTQRELAQCRDEAILQQKKSFLTDNEAVAQLLDNAALKDIKLLFKLLKSVRLELQLRPAWEAYIIHRGSAIVEDKDRQAEMVVRLLDFKLTLDHIWTMAFQEEERLDSSLRESFASFVNERRKGSSSDTNNSRVGEMIAKHMDMLLRGGMKAMTKSLRTVASIEALENPTAAEAAAAEDAELNAQLDLALDLFRFIEGKDVFEAFYKNDLSKRLLMSRSASDDAEKSMLTKLRTECGAGFTHNLEQMFKDIDLAKDEMTSFKAIRRNAGTVESIDLNVNVLSSASWPTFTDIPLKLPQEIAIVIDHYDRHYKSKHSGRTLSWKHDLAHCIMRAQFPKGIKEIVFSSAQAVVVLLFNDVEEKNYLTYSQILTASGLPEEKLKVTLQSLACAKYRVLSKHPRGREVNPTDTFSINTSFSDPKYRIKINQIQMKETKAENKATHEQVARDRQYETQAAIVRIMKGRKTISHAELVSEVITQTKKRGHLEVREIKTQIDKLIDKEYLERDGSNGYTYLA